MCLSALVIASVSAVAEKKAVEEKVPLEKKLDKRGLLNLGYGYGINGLDVGYLGKSEFSPYLSHGAPLAAHGFAGHGYGYGPYVADVTKTVTLVKGVPYPVEKPVGVPYPVERPVPYPVKVPVPQPYEVIKHVPGESNNLAINNIVIYTKSDDIHFKMMKRYSDLLLISFASFFRLQITICTYNFLLN